MNTCLIVLVTGVPLIIWLIVLGRHVIGGSDQRSYSDIELYVDRSSGWLKLRPYTDTLTRAERYAKVIEKTSVDKDKNREETRS